MIVFEMLITHDEDPTPTEVEGGSLLTTDNGDGTWTITSEDNITRVYDFPSNMESVEILKGETLLSMEDMFGYTSIDKFVWTTGACNVTTMSGAWAYSGLQELEITVDTSSVTNFDSAWINVPITPFPYINISGATSMRSAWSWGRFDTFPENMDFSNVTDLNNTWRKCTSLKSMPSIDTSKVTDFDNAWKDCTSLKCIASLDTTSCTNAANNAFINTPLLLTPYIHDEIRNGNSLIIGKTWINPEICPILDEIPHRTAVRTTKISIDPITAPFSAPGVEGDIMTDDVGEIFIYHLHRWVPYPIGGGGGSAELDRYIKPTINVGGIDTSMEFIDGTNLSSMWQQLIAPYVPPTLHIVINPGNTVEVGTVVTIANADLSWTLDSDGAVPVDPVIAGQGFSGIVDIDDGTTSKTINAAPSTTVTKPTPAIETWTFSAKGTDGAEVTHSDSIAWKHRLYYGNNSSSAVNESEIEAMLYFLRFGSSGTYGYTEAAGNYKWFCVVSTEAQPTNFKDKATNLDIPFEAPITVAITNQGGIALSMKCYRSTNQLGGAMTINVT